eukprot:scaffold6347_cov124-Isochrysis_galbana.AAC.1
MAAVAPICCILGWHLRRGTAPITAKQPVCRVPIGNPPRHCEPRCAGGRAWRQAPRSREQAGRCGWKRAYPLTVAHPPPGMAGPRAWLLQSVRSPLSSAVGRPSPPRLSLRFFSPCAAARACALSSSPGCS